MRWDLAPFLLLVVFLLSGISGCGQGRAHVAEAIDAHAAATGSVALAEQHLREALASHDADAARRVAAATEERDRAQARSKAADDALAHQREQAAIDEQHAAQASDYRSGRLALVASAVLVALSFRLPAISGLLLTLATATGAAAYGFAAAGWLRGHLWLIPLSASLVALALVVHHLLGKDHVLSTPGIARAGAIRRWLPSTAAIRKHWHLPPWLTAIGALFHRRTPTTPPAPAG